MTISGSDTAYQKEIRLRPAGDSLSFQDFSVFVVLQAGVRLQGKTLTHTWQNGVDPKVRECPTSPVFLSEFTEVSKNLEIVESRSTKSGLRKYF